MRITYIVITIITVISFWGCFASLLYCYHHNKKKGLFLTLLIITILLFIIWGFFRNFNKPNWD